MKLRFGFLGVALVFASVALTGIAAAGPNANGTLIFHSCQSPACTSDQPAPLLCDIVQNELPRCADAIPQQAWFEGRAISVFAAFPESSSPRLKAVHFGIASYTGGPYLWGMSCADMEVPTAGWPAPDEGVVCTWNSARTSILVPVYLFYGYAYDTPTAQVTLGPHPADGGLFDDDAGNADLIAGYGTMGFGTSGNNVCPTGTSEVPESRLPTWGGVKARYR